MKISVCPGSNEVISEATTLFGTHRVVASAGFREPVYIHDLNKDEASFCKEYFEEMGKKVVIE